MKNKLKSLHYNIAVGLLLLLPPCYVIFDILYRLKINPTFGQLSVYLYLFILTFLFIKSIRLSVLQKQIIFLYIIIAIYLLILALFYYDDPLDKMKMVRVHFKNIIIGVLVFLLINCRKFNIIKFNNFFINLAVIFSFLSILLYMKFLIGGIHVSPVTYEQGQITYFRVGILGFFNYSPFGNMGGWQILPRSQSFWTEPSKFAQFLILPLFLSYTRYSHQKSFRYLLKFLIILISFILTFSVASYFGILLGISILNFINLSRNKQSIRIKFKYFFLFLIFILVIWSLYNVTNSGRYGESVITKDTNTTLIVRLDRISHAMTALNKGVFGDIKLYRIYTGNSTAFGWIIMIGGLPALSIVSIILFKFLTNLIRKIRYGSNALIFSAFIAYFISHTWYGNYIGIEFIMLLGIYTKYFNYDNVQKEII